MNLFQAVIFGIVEGLTEFLPVSSTGHLILMARALGLSQTEFLKSFEIAIQLGAILSVVVLYFRSLFLNLEMVKRILTAFLPTAILGFVFYQLIKKILLESYAVILGSLLIGGVVLIIFDLLYQEKKRTDQSDELVSYPQAILIGLFQSLAMIPGVSRSAATIIGGLMLGIQRKTIVEFSFLLAVPTMLAATTLDLWKNASYFSFDQFQFLAVGFLTSFLVAILSIKFFLQFIKNHNFVAFGIYRILLALLCWWTFLR